MSVPVTLHIHESRELKLAKNFLILGILMNALSYPFGFSPLLVWALSILGFAFSTAGFYKLSKLTRNQTLFKYYTFSVFNVIVMGLILGFTLPHEVPTSPSAGLFVVFAIVLICFAFYFYFFYRICAELTKITTLRFFVLAFKGMMTGIIIFLIGCLFFAIKDVFYLFSMASLIVFMIGGISFIVGIFGIKKVVYERD